MKNCSCFLSIFLMVLLCSCEKDPILERQVISIDTEQNDNYLIQVENHISLTERPLETFPFPIKIGEIGPVESLYSGNKQYPFYCMTIDAGLGQPVVDNQLGIGVRVYDKANKLIGFSKDCLTRTRLDYYYTRSDNGRIENYSLENPPSLSEIAKTRINGQSVPEIYRLERGSINRYIYYIAMLVPANNVGNRLDKSYWNNKLIYQFKGGASIGFRQGRLRPERLIKRRQSQLSQGYAIIASSGNHTGYGYNMLLAEDTARRVKRQFTALYGDPIYTMGLGGSGGALAQYLIAQNSNGILDGLMPLYSYPDMVSQSIFLLDCDLLHHYFNITDQENERWEDWEQRQAIEGMNGINGFEYPYWFIQPLNQIIAGEKPTIPSGSSECVRSWFIAATFFYNPKQGFIKPYFSEAIEESVKWTYWEDLVQIYGKDNKGFARTTWGNRGVQYGLEALRNKTISIQEFIHLNQYIGSWVNQDEMQEETALNLFGLKYPVWLSMWSRNNITKPNHTVAKRKVADTKAIEQGYKYGQIFVGKAELPILELRHYLEEKLDMHHASASFETRMRIEDFQGHSKNHVIWITHKNHTPIPEAVDYLDEWILKHKASKTKDVIASKPKGLLDACFDNEGNTVFQGNGVWDGPWNNRPNGSCTDYFPIYSNPRIQAGGPWTGSIFQCGLIPVTEAIKKGLYGSIEIAQHKGTLETIFPHGVCDYSLGDKGKPDLRLKPSLEAKL